MNRRHFLALACLSALACSAPADPKTASLPRRAGLVVAGQSNVIAQLGTDPRPSMPVPYIARSLGPVGYEFDTGLEPVDLGPVAGFHSFELAAADTLRAAGVTDLVVLKVARGSSWLGQWRDGSPAHYWDALVEAKQRADLAWGSDVEWSVAWMQSESDSTQQVYAADYETNLRAFALAAHQLFGGRFYQCKLQPSLGAGGTGALIRDAQVRVMAEQPWSQLLDFDDLNGELHYKPPQLDEVGRRVGLAIASTLR